MASGLPHLIERTTAQFEKNFGCTPTLLAAAPGRVNLIGEHIDYCDGFVLPCALPLYTLIAAAPAAEDHLITLDAGKKFPRTTIDLREPVNPGEPFWANYLKGVLASFLEFDSPRPLGFNAQISTNIPLGAGLSSSAALEVAFATLLEQITGHILTKKEKALLAQKAEHDFAGMPCGIMDQFASAYGEEGHLVLIDCQAEEASLISFERNDLDLVICNSMVSHSLADGEYAKRRADAEEALRLSGETSWRDLSLADLPKLEKACPERIYHRARHIITESKRVIDATKALKDDDFLAFGQFMYRSHSSLRDDYEVSCPELDLLVDLAKEAGPAGGVLGSRMTGGGFGGSTITLCHSSHTRQFIAHLSSRYMEETGHKPDIIVAKPARGAHLV
ncbi:galactokinase [Rubritalea halochordaticola]|uniref:Galactokinase n=1 Tax=Rubritalea halochordaticola TaxID=714537 RepID=A0ABP9V422_9BACT